MSEQIYSIRELLKSRSREHGYRLLVRSLTIRRGDRIAITGPSGCGKSTTLDILGLSLSPDSARQFLFAPPEGQSIRILPLWKGGHTDALAAIRMASMGYVLQSGELLPYLNVAENIMLPALLAGMSKTSARESALALAQRLGIDSLLQALPGTLSVGERQRAAIARALAAHPAVILADEPTAALDPLHAKRVMITILEAVKNLGSTLILVTHNEPWAMRGGLKILRFEMAEDSQGTTAILDDAETDHEPGL